MLGQLGGFYNLSRKLSSAGMPSFSPLRLRVSATTWEGRLALSKGSPGRICQWSNTHWGKAWPPVLDLRSAVKPGEESRDERWFPAASRHHLSHRADVVHVVSNSTNLSHSSATVTFHFPLIPFRNAAGDPQQDPKGAPKPPRGHPSLQGWQLAGHLAAYIPSSWSGAAGHQGSPTRAGFRIYLPVAVSSCAPLATLPEPPHSPKDSLTGR